METSAGNQPRQHDVPGSLAAAGIGPPSKSRADPFGPADPVCTDLSCGGRRSLFGWSPPPEAADTHLKRWVDQLMPRTGLPALLFFAAIVAVLAFAAHLPMRGALAVDGLAALAGGGWCSLNFWRCRHAHCLVTGVGWIALSGFAFAEAGLGRSVMAGDEQLVLVGILVAALTFELLWSKVTGSNAVARRLR